MKVLSSLAIAAVLATPTIVSAQDYLHLFVGGNSNADATFSGNIGGAPQTVDTDFDTGLNFGFAYGRDFGTFRGELELSRGTSDVDTIDFSGNGAGNEGLVAGDVTSTRLFANALRDFDNGSTITPYVGAGIGVVRVDNDLVYGAAGVAIPDSDTVFGAQLIAGAAYDLNETTAVTLDGRYGRAFGVESRRISPAGVATVEEDIDTFSVNVGVRSNF